MIGGVLGGGWVADRTDRHLPFVVVLTIGAAALLLLVGVISLAELPTIAVLLVAGAMTGASRTPRDVMVKDAAPPGRSARFSVSSAPACRWAGRSCRCRTA